MDSEDRDLTATTDTTGEPVTQPAVESEDCTAPGCTTPRECRWWGYHRPGGNGSSDDE